MHGVDYRENVCVMGFICTITITGNGMHRRNAIRILKPGYECWDEQPDLVSNYEIMSITNPRANSDGVAFGADPTGRIYTMGFIERGAVSTRGYTICYTPNQYNTVDFPFNINIGTLSLSGPSLSDNWCHLGEICTVYVQGVNLHENNIGRISLNEQCPVASNYLIVPYSDWTAIENRDWYMNNPYSVANPNKPEENALYYDSETPHYNVIGVLNASDYNNSMTGNGFTTYVSMNVGTLVEGTPGRGRYYLCWGRSITDFPSIQVGYFHLHGPGSNSIRSQVAAEQTCTVGYECYLTMSMVEGRNYGYVKLMKPGRGCNDTDPQSLYHV